MQMTNAEICNNFKQSKNKNAQIGILAELNACSTAKIMEILTAGGCADEVTSESKRARESKRASWTVEMDKQLVTLWEQGVPPAKIAESLGVSSKQVSDRKSYLKRKGYFPAPAEGEKKQEKAPEKVPEKAPEKTNPIAWLFDSVPEGVAWQGAAVWFRDEAGESWKMQMIKEDMNND